MPSGICDERGKRSPARKLWNKFKANLALSGVLFVRTKQYRIGGALHLPPGMIDRMSLGGLC